MGTMSGMIRQSQEESPIFIKAPVYSDHYSTHKIQLFKENESGQFSRSGEEPFHVLRQDIDGISLPQGQMYAHRYERCEFLWRTPTVVYHYGRPMSYYSFLRQHLKINRFFVFCPEHCSGRALKFTLHELRFKSSFSQRKLRLFKDKYMASLDLWQKPPQVSDQGAVSNIIHLSQRKKAQQMDPTGPEKIRHAVIL